MEVKKHRRVHCQYFILISKVKLLEFLACLLLKVEPPDRHEGKTYLTLFLQGNQPRWNSSLALPALNYSAGATRAAWPWLIQCKNGAAESHTTATVETPLTCSVHHRLGWLKQHRQDVSCNKSAKLLRHRTQLSYSLFIFVRLADVLFSPPQTRKEQ